MVQVGQKVTVDGIEYRFGETSSEIYNLLIEYAEKGLEPADQNISICPMGSEVAASISFSNLREAVKKSSS